MCWVCQRPSKYRPYFTLLKLAVESLRPEWARWQQEIPVEEKNKETPSAAATTVASLDLTIQTRDTNIDRLVEQAMTRLKNLFACPLPSPCSRIEVVWPGSFRYRLGRPQGLPVVDPYCFECLFSCLSITNIAALLGCSLVEDNILLYTRRWVKREIPTMFSVNAR